MTPSTLASPAPPTPGEGSGELAIELKGVVKEFGTFRAVDTLELAVPRGTIYGLLGPNGSGKTTTIRMIMGILEPDSGTVSLFGGRPDNARRERVGYLPEERGLYKRMKVLEHLVFLGRIRGVEGRRARTLAMDWLDRLELADRADKRVEDLSKGMQQKVQFIGTVLHEPDLLILDEPFSGLDPINQDVLEEIVLEFSRKGTTILFSTHVMAQAERICDRIVLMARGQKIFDGKVDEALAVVPRLVTIGVDSDDDISALLSGFGEVTRAEKDADGVTLWQIALKPGVDPQHVLRACVEAGVRLTRFEPVRPHLHDAFVRLVSAGDPLQPVEGQ